MSVKNAVYPRKIHYFGRLIKLCQIIRFGVPKEPKIMRMDWRSAGYWPVYKDGKKVWVPKDAVQETSQDTDTTA